MRARLVRRFVAAGILLGGLTACVPDVPPPTPPDQRARPVLSVSSGPAGSLVDVAAPDGECDIRPDAPSYAQYSQLLAGITVPRTGAVIVQATQYIGASPSGYGANDAFVRLRVPPAAAPGVYHVLLACQSYVDSYAFEPATFTVTP